MDLAEGEEEPATILFATIPFEYLADAAEEWAQRGVKGFMLAGIMRNWDSDVWSIGGDSRIVGEGNPLWARLRRMNEACKRWGIDRNFIKVAFYSHLPDWFDDDGWSQLCDNFRQGALLARDTRFRGMAIDIEYINETYDLSWQAYQRPGYPASKLRGMARSRGAQIVEAMLAEFPTMEVLHLPQSPECYGPLAADLFAGMLSGMAKAKAPGGLHLLTEATYQRTDVDWLVAYGQQLDEIVEGTVARVEWPYWRERCSISYGLWPLGYYRKIMDDKGQFLGYGGKRETFGDTVVGSTADKSENYTVEEFRRQFAISRMLCKRYVWIYCHGSTFWQLNPEQMSRYGGRETDRLPLVENVDDYVGVLRGREIIADGKVQRLAARIREGSRVDLLGPMGYPRTWNIIGPFDNSGGAGFRKRYPPETRIDLNGTYEGVGAEARWQEVRVGSTGFVDFGRAFRPKDYRCAYALVYAQLPKERKATILLGSDDGAKLWIGGHLVYEHDVVRGAEPDDDRIPVTLPAGRFPVLLKVTNHRGAWGFYLRMTDENGSPLQGLSFSPS